MFWNTVSDGTPYIIDSWALVLQYFDSTQGLCPMSFDRARTTSLYTFSTQNAFRAQTLDIAALTPNVQDILMINKIRSVLTSKLIKLPGEINSSLLFNFIDQS